MISTRWNAYTLSQSSEYSENAGLKEMALLRSDLTLLDFSLRLL